MMLANEDVLRLQTSSGRKKLELQLLLPIVTLTVCPTLIRGSEMDEYVTGLSSWGTFSQSCWLCCPNWFFLPPTMDRPYWRWGWNLFYQLNEERIKPSPCQLFTYTCVRVDPCSSCIANNYSKRKNKVVGKVITIYVSRLKKTPSTMFVSYSYSTPHVFLMCMSWEEGSICVQWKLRLAIRLYY